MMKVECIFVVNSFLVGDHDVSETEGILKVKFETTFYVCFNECAYIRWFLLLSFLSKGG